MSGLGGLNKTPDGVVIGLVQLQLPTIATKSDLAAQTKKICAMVQKARKNMSTMDLVVFPEYSLHGLSMDTNRRPDVAARRSRSRRASGGPASTTASGAASPSWSTTPTAILTIPA